MLQLLVKEEVFGSGTTNELPVTFSSDRLTLGDLIQTKVAAKVKKINEEMKENSIHHRFLSKKEKILNQPTLQSLTEKERQRVENLRLDPEKEGYEALAAFQNNAFFVIIDGRQREELEEEVLLTPNSEVQFIRLMPLVGG